jgi:hypothetical protein
MCTAARRQGRGQRRIGMGRSGKNRRVIEEKITAEEHI